MTALAPAGPIHIHAAEQIKEVEDCLAWSGARPVQWLLDNADVDARWCLVHATHLTPEEITRLARSGAVAGFCPVTEANLGDGIAPAAPYMAAGGTFGIGTDSNVRSASPTELCQLEYSQRLRDRARNVIGAGDSRSTGRVLFEGAVRGGAQALGGRAPASPQALARISSLCRADPPRSSIVARMLARQPWIFAGGTCIDCVWRRGEAVSSGEHKAREESRSLSSDAEAAARAGLSDLRYSSVDTGFTARILARAEGDYG